MKLVLMIPAASALVLFLSSCGNTGSSAGGSQVSTGPFDSAGRYREDWADDPSKWRKTGGSPSPHEMKSDEIPRIARNEEPPPESNPLPPAQISKPAPPITRTRVTTKPTAEEKSTEVAVRTKSIDKSEGSSTTKRSTTKTETSTARAKPKPKPVLVKAKTKPKPKSVRYVVKKGDSLSVIASRTGSTVAAIKSENDISGTLIRPGQSLRIPKK